MCDKYDIHWQIVRVSVKGVFNNDLPKKIAIVMNYYNANPNKTRWERVLNWLTGLEKGVKDEYKKNYLKNEIDLFQKLSPFQEVEATVNSVEAISKYSKSQLCHLYLDLFTTNKKWLQNGYIHEGCNDFLDRLAEAIGEEYIASPYRRDVLVELRMRAKLTPNTHKFLF